MRDQTVYFAPEGSGDFQELPLIEGGFEDVPESTVRAIQAAVDADEARWAAQERAYRPNRATRRKQEREARRARRG